MADLMLRNVRLTAWGDSDDADGATSELVFHHAHVQLEAISGEVDGDGQADLEGFWLVVTEAGLNDEPMPDAVRVRIPMQPEPLRLLCSGVLDWLDKVRAPATRGTVRVAGSSEIVQLGRAERRRRERGQG